MVKVATGSPGQHLYMNYTFSVEVQGCEAARFTECTGLQIETKNAGDMFVGGRNGASVPQYGYTTVAPITLKYGVSLTDQLWNWYQKVRQGDIHYMVVTITLHNSNEGVKGGNVQWILQDALPVKYAGSALSASASAYTIDAFTIACCGGVRRIPGP
jgi:phage tail-like protein